METEQKDMMQLFGKWGYTPQKLQVVATKEKEKCMNDGDKIGAVALETIINCCEFAQSNNAVDAVTKRIRQSDEKFMALKGDDAEGFLSNLIGNNLLDKLKEVSEGQFELSLDAYSEGVIDATFDRIVDKKSYQEAVLFLRQQVMDGIAPMFMRDIIDRSQETGTVILNMIIKFSVAYYEIENGIDNYVEINHIAMNRFDKTTSVICNLKDEILDLPNKFHKNFPSITSIIVSIFEQHNIPESFNWLANHKLIEVTKMKPHEISAYCDSYIVLMTLFYVGVGMGLFDMKKIVSSLEISSLNDILTDESLDAIERTRSN